MKTSTLWPITTVSALALIVLFPNAPALAQGCPAPSFAPAVHYGTGSGCWSVAVGDFNGDGKPDLAAANRYARNISVLLGNGDGTFQTAFNSGDGGYESVAVGDFDADGEADLVVGNGSFGNVSVLLGNGNGTFQAPVTYPAGIHPGPLAVADFNKDGKPDLAAANVGTDQVSVLLGNGDGTFQSAVSYTAGSGSQSVAVGDCNGDGNPDLVAPHYFLFEFWVDSGVAVLLGNGDGTFQSAVDYQPVEGPVSAPLGDWLLSAVVGDFNRDGKPDLAVANKNKNSSNSRNVLVLSGNGDGTFQHSTNYSAGLGAQAVAVSDFDGDGQPDLAVANGSSDDVSVLVGKGDGTFQAATSYGAGDRPQSVAVGDFNGDGRPDLATANERSGNVSVLLNLCAPTGISLNLMSAGTDFILSWPLPDADFLLQSTTNFNSTTWQQVLETRTTNNGRCEVTVPLDRTQRYFRLVKP